MWRYLQKGLWRGNQVNTGNSVGPDPNGLVSVLLRGDQDTGTCGGGTTWRQQEDRHPQATERGLRRSPSLPAPCSQTSSLQSCEEIRFWCKSPQAVEHCWGHPRKLIQVLFKKKQSISKDSFFLFLATSMNWFSWKPEIHNSIKAEIVPSVAFLNSPTRLTMEFPSESRHRIHNKYSHKRFFPPNSSSWTHKSLQTEGFRRMAW